MKFGRCEFCIFFIQETCRRHAPIAVLTPGMTVHHGNNARTVERWNVETQWPTVDALDGCGDFQMDPTR